MPGSDVSVVRPTMAGNDWVGDGRVTDSGAIGVLVTGTGVSDSNRKESLRFAFSTVRGIKSAHEFSPQTESFAKWRTKPAPWKFGGTILGFPATVVLIYFAPVGAL